MAFERADRLQALPTYLFVQIDRRKRAAIAAGADVIDFGIGDPDRPTPGFIIERMQQAVAEPTNHRYPAGQGAAAFRQAIAGFFARRYGVELDPDQQLWAAIGSKEALAHLPLACLNPGDVTIVPEPGYPVYRSATLLAGGEPWTLPLLAEKGWQLDLGDVPADVARRAKLLFLNYPNNPTGAVATAAFFEEVVAFAHTNDLVVVQDAAYNDLYLTEAPRSILQTPGAFDVAIELHSASKTFNMTGWRVGFAAGNAAVVQALGQAKSVIDSGVFSAVQQAAVTAYEGFDRPELEQLRVLYRERARLLVEGLRAVGFEAAVPPATFYIWAKVPVGYDSMGLASKLLDEAAVVCVPGAGFGPAGEGYVRFALTVPQERISEAVQRLRGLAW